MDNEYRILFQTAMVCMTLVMITAFVCDAIRWE